MDKEKQPETEIALNTVSVGDISIQSAEPLDKLTGLIIGLLENSTIEKYLEFRKENNKKINGSYFG